MNLLALQDAVSRPFFDLASGTTDLDLIGAWMVAFFTLSVFSFLYKDNPFYKLAEHVFVGAGTAFFTLQYYEEGILEPLYEHMDRAVESMVAGGSGTVALGGYDVAATTAIAFRSLAVVFSIMLLWRLVKKDSWAPRWPLAIMVGVYAALKMTGETQAKLVLQVKGLMRPLVTEGSMAWGDDWSFVEQTTVFTTFASLVLLIGTVCALGHFVFTYRRTRFLGGVSRVGVVVLMVTFGSMFGFTVLGRIALLIDRVQALGDVSGEGYQLAGVDGGWLANATSPPMLAGALIVLVLLAAKLTGHDDYDHERQDA